MSNDRKKIEKKKAREELKRKEKADLDERKLYPTIQIDAKNGEPDLVKLISLIVQMLPLSDRKIFCSEEQRFYKNVKKLGIKAVLAVIDDAINKSQNPDVKIRYQKIKQILACGYGERVFNFIPDAIRKIFFPFCDFRVTFEGRIIMIVFDQLLQEKSSMGTVYFGRKRPKITFYNENYIVAFSKHSIERICERQNPRYLKTYAALGDAFSFFGNCVYYEPVTLHGGQNAFLIYSSCDTSGFVQHSSYVEKVFEKINVKHGKGQCYYKVGYCPVVLENGFAKAKTFLIPGYLGTPEYSLLLNSKLDREEKTRLLEMTKDATEDDVHFGDNIELIKWFHDNGIPQVVQMKQKVYDYN